ncbi:MAG: hypothetical protein MI810_15070 [Flavobacteriales bacterium]|jgi:hypothetical protein|nr:hypothetical protein [Flavobacteriales bacterium]
MRMTDESMENMEQEEIKVELRQFKRHERKFPWRLLWRVIVAVLILGLLYYFSKLVEEKATTDTESSDDEIEIIFE